MAAPTLAAAHLMLIEDRPIVTGVYVNEEGPFKFLIDTGANFNQIDHGVARRISLMTASRSSLRSSIGSVPVLQAEGAAVTLGTCKANDQRFVVGGVDAVRRLAPVDGVLGQEFLSRFDYVLDLRAHQIEFGKQEIPSPGVRVSFQMINGRIVISTNLGPLVLDSGARQIILFGIEAVRPTREMFTNAGSMLGGTIQRNLFINGHSLWQGDAVAVPRTEETEFTSATRRGTSYLTNWRRQGPTITLR